MLFYRFLLKGKGRMTTDSNTIFRAERYYPNVDPKVDELRDVRTKVNYRK